MEIEISIDDDLFARATRYAEARGTTVEQLIREFLENLSRDGPGGPDTRPTE